MTSNVEAVEVAPGKWRWKKGTEESIGWWSSKAEAIKAGERGQK